MSLVANIILPVFGLVALGYVAGLVGWMKPAAIEGLSTFVFNFAIPVMLFQSIAVANLPGELPITFLISYYGATIVLFALTLAIGRVLRLGGTGSSIFAMSASYSNVVLLGIPLVDATLGEAGLVPLFIIVSTHAAVMFVLTTLFAELGRGEPGKIALLPLATVRMLARNMIVVGLCIGLVINLSGITLPATIDKMASYLGNAALPCAVFSMGASISLYRIDGELWRVALGLGIKNLLHPLLVWFLAAMVFELHGDWVAVATILAACPSGINAYLFASRYQAIVESTATLVVLSTLVSIPSLTLCLYLLA